MSSVPMWVSSAGCTWCSWFQSVNQRRIAACETTRPRGKQASNTAKRKITPFSHSYRLSVLSVMKQPPGGEPPVISPSSAWHIHNIRNRPRCGCDVDLVHRSAVVNSEFSESSSSEKATMGTRHENVVIHLAL
jgi:hypothetical protein